MIIFLRRSILEILGDSTLALVSLFASLLEAISAPTIRNTSKSSEGRTPNRRTDTKRYWNRAAMRRRTQSPEGSQARRKPVQETQMCRESIPKGTQIDTKSNSVAPVRAVVPSGCPQGGRGGGVGDDFGSDLESPGDPKNSKFAEQCYFWIP